MLNRLPEVLDTVQEWRGITLDNEQMREYATKAAMLRFGEDEKAPYSPHHSNYTRRREDAFPTLWHTFNRVQENLMKGGFRSRFTGRRVRSITGINENVRLNRALWELTEETARKV